jgi:hypothetical protein
MIRPLLRAALVLGMTLVAGPGVIFAQSPCDAPAAVPGVTDSARVSLFMTGVPNDRGLGIGRVSYLNFNDIAPRLKSVSLAGFQPIDVRVAGNGRSVPRQRAGFVSGSYFDVLGVRLQAGRAFSPSDDIPGRAPLTAVISDALWESLFDRNASAIGRTITANDREVTIVGVAEPAFLGVRGPRFEEHVWLPGVTLADLNEQPGLRSDDRAFGGYYLFAGRLNAGGTWPDAHAELASLTKWLAEKYPAANAKFSKVGFHDLGPLGCSTT